MLDRLIAPLAATLAQSLDCEVAAVERVLAPPTKAGMGDLAMPCFPFAKQRGVPPPQLAGELAEALVQAHPGIAASAAGPFLNIVLPPQQVAATLLEELAAHPEAALRIDDGQGRTVCIDFSSPNIAKHLAFHHIRSTMIGNALAHCYAAANWNVVRINFLGDWGTAFGRLIAGWKREGLTLEQLQAAEDQVAFLNQLYVRISQAAQDDDAVADEARAWSRKLEAGDEEARRLWQIFKDASLAEFRKVYDLLGVDFDSWKGEAHYEQRMQPLLDELAERGLTSEDQGALVVDLSAKGFKKPALIQRSDGGTLYATRDLTACDDRHREYAFDRALYVVDLGQGLHFKEWFAIAELLGRAYAAHLRHVGFGLVLMWNEDEQTWGKSATRRGVPMMLVDVLREAIERAEAIVADKNPELPEAERHAVAEAVGVGAVVFNDLKNSRTGDVKFRFEDALNMQGETGPYLQYAHARLCSIERKFSERFATAEAPDWSRIERDDEKAVLLAIARLAPTLQRVVDQDEPSALAGALLSLAGTVSSWLSAGNRDTGARVLCDDAVTAATRLRLVAAARAAIGEGLRLLGLRAPQRM